MCIVTGCRFDKASPHSTLYKRRAEVGALVWRDNTLECLAPEDTKQLDDELGRQSRESGATDKSGPLAKR